YDECLEAQTGGIVRAGAERHAGIDFDADGVARIARIPRRVDQYACRDLCGAKMLHPCGAISCDIASPHLDMNVREFRERCFESRARGGFVLFIVQVDAPAEGALGQWARFVDKNAEGLIVVLLKALHTRL